MHVHIPHRPPQRHAWMYTYIHTHTHTHTHTTNVLITSNQLVETRRIQWQFSMQSQSWKQKIHSRHWDSWDWFKLVTTWASWKVRRDQIPLYYHQDVNALACKLCILLVNTASVVLLNFPYEPKCKSKCTVLNHEHISVGQYIIQLMIIHQHTTFGYKRCSGSEDSFWTKPGHMDSQKHGCKSTVIPIIYTPNSLQRGRWWGQGGYKNAMVSSTSSIIAIMQVSEVHQFSSYSKNLKTTSKSTCFSTYQ